MLLGIKAVSEIERKWNCKNKQVVERKFPFKELMICYYIRDDVSKQRAEKLKLAQRMRVCKFRLLE